MLDNLLAHSSSIHMGRHMAGYTGQKIFSSLFAFAIQPLGMV
jgi:hypothetical protein